MTTFEDRFAAGVAELAATRRRAAVLARPRVLLSIAGGLMTLGPCLILVGWWGAARATLVQEQIAYLVSGGLVGVALTAIGAASLLAHWLTAAEAARRQDHRELMAALEAVTSGLADQEARGNGSSGRPRAQRPLRPAPGRT